jgi:hypothetical protein
VNLAALVTVVVAASGLIIALGYYYSRDVRIKRAIRKTALVTTQSFRDRSMGKIHGVLRYLDEPLTAPLSGKKCAYYEVTVEEYRSSGKSGSWHEIICERQGDAFSARGQRRRGPGEPARRRGGGGQGFPSRVRHIQ